MLHCHGYHEKVRSDLVHGGVHGLFMLRTSRSPQHLGSAFRSDFDQKSNSDRLDDSRGPWGCAGMVGRVGGRLKGGTIRLYGVRLPTIRAGSEMYS